MTSSRERREKKEKINMWKVMPVTHISASYDHREFSAEFKENSRILSEF